MKRKILEWATPVADFLNLRPDSIAHASVGAVLVIICYLVFRWLQRSKESRPVLGAFWIALFLSIAWECYFQFVESIKPEWADMVANLAGFVSGTALVFVLEKMHPKYE